jgi:TFIIH basal transcription factor complex TTD-A subunit
VVVCSDAAVKQLILSLDERNRFIIMDLDDTHLLISPERIDWLRSELELEVSFSSTLQ